MPRLYICILIMGILEIMTTNLNAQPKSSIYTSWEDGFTNSLNNSHDMALPSWGPYSDRFNGISHVPAENNGFRFDVLVQPSLYLRNLTPLANVKRESGYHPWQAAPDLSYFSYRFELEWKDRVFCDVSFSHVDDQSRLIRAEFVNNTGSNRSLALNVFNSINFPYGKRIIPVLPDGVKWQKAADYINLTNSVIPWQYNLVYNGQLRGQINDDNAISHTAIVIGKNAGENVFYHFPNNRTIKDGVMMLRYKTVSGGTAIVRPTINGKLLNTVEIPGTKEYATAVINVENLPPGDIEFSLQAMNNMAIKLDGFILIRQNEAASIKFREDKLNYVPKQIASGLSNAIVLKFDDIKEYYGLVWSDLSAEKRELFDDNPDQALSVFENLVRKAKGSRETTRINGNDKGWFKNIFSAPIIIKPQQKAVRYAYVVYGSDEKEVIAQLKRLNSNWENAETLYNNQRSAINYDQYNKAGKPYQLSQQLMAATTLTNLLYPTFTANQYVKHTTPGKKWSSLYTWDSGFIGLGYSTLNTGRALESLNAYTMDAGEQSAFLEHGTPLPVQAYLFNELWNKTQNIEYLKYFYPRLKRYYNFLGGAESSPTRKLKSGLIKTWDIFYNSGGWDDYCPQVFVHKQKLESSVAPTINTAHQIRFAKLLKMAAWQLGYQDDMAKYDSDISMYSKALQDHAWDELSGYYGYVKHGRDGRPTGILEYSHGVNFNMGLDGCSPLIAGICTPKQKEKIIEHLFTKGQLWADQGITAIDQSAPYYDKDGYWNGRVWMPHQWFFWKTMLDLNEPEKAIRIASTALDVWKRETDDTYNCWENFSIESGNGGGWHQFGALSSPVLNWYSSLYKQGTVTHGFNIWPISQKFSANNDGFKGEFKLFADQNIRTATLLLCLNDKTNYEAKCNGKSIPLHQVFEGLYFIKIELGASENDKFSLELTKKN
jgi:hypothetical protein